MDHLRSAGTTGTGRRTCAVEALRSGNLRRSRTFSRAHGDATSADSLAPGTSLRKRGVPARVPQRRRIRLGPSCPARRSSATPLGDLGVQRLQRLREPGTRFQAAAEGPHRSILEACWITCRFSRPPDLAPFGRSAGRSRTPGRGPKVRAPCDRPYGWCSSTKVVHSSRRATQCTCSSAMSP